MYQPSAKAIVDYPSFVVNYDRQKPENETGLAEIQSIVLFTLHDIRPEKIRRIKAETGFGGKSSWLNPVFGNHLINLCQKKG